LEVIDGMMNAEPGALIFFRRAGAMKFAKGAINTGE
jgi:hypothetical protein